MAEKQIYSLDWADKFIPERHAILDRLGVVVEFKEDGTMLIEERGYSSSQREAIKFVQSLTPAVNFTIFDRSIGRLVLDLHTRFWTYYFSR